MGIGRDSVMVRVGRLFQRVPLAWLRLVEAPFVYGIKKARYEPTMIILLALPRSGSTLSYQIIVHALQTGYLNNMSNLLYQIPLIGGILSSVLCKRHRSDFTSNQGFVSGLCGPAEGLQFWRYWLDYGLDERNKYVMDSSVRVKRLGYIRRVFSLISRADYPFVTGYLGHSLNPQRLKQEFSNAVIVRLYRDPVSIAMSILKSRRASGTDWFSLFPIECRDTLGQGVHAEVAAQVYWLNRRLDALNAAENVFAMNYEALCQHPEERVQALIKFCNTRGMNVSLKGQLPDEFEYRFAVPETCDDASKLKLAISELESRYGKLQQFKQQ